MPITPRGHNVVIVAEQFRTGIFSDHWLIRNGIVRDGAIVGNRVSTEAMSTVTTGLFELVATPDRLQVSLVNLGAHAYNELCEPVTKMIEKIPDPGFSALGLNHSWNVLPENLEGGSVGDFLRRRFAVDDAFGQIAAGPNGIWGTQVTKEWNGSVCRTSVIPAFRKGDPSRNPTGFVVDCNFHFDLTEQADPLASIRQAMGKFNEAGEHSYQIAVTLG